MIDEPRDDRPGQAPPGFVAWGVTGASLAMPIFGAVLGAMGVSNGGNDINPWLFFTGFGFLVLSVVLSIVVHLWGMVKAFYPRISMAWMAICLLGIVGGILTFGAGVFLLMRLFGAA